MKRSLDQFPGVGSSLGHKNDMFCLPGVVFFFSRKVSFVSPPNIRIGSNAFNNLEGCNPRRPLRIHLFVCKKSSSAHSRRASRQLLAKEYALKLVNCPRRASTVILWLSNRPSRYDLICLPWSFLTSRVIYPFKRRACQVYRVG